jgi:hypothetical protein
MARVRENGTSLARKPGAKFLRTRCVNTHSLVLIAIALG